MGHLLAFDEYVSFSFLFVFFGRIQNKLQGALMEL